MTRARALWLAGIGVALAAAIGSVYLAPLLFGRPSPERYQKDLLRVERLLYRPAPPYEGYGQELSRQASALRRQVERDWAPSHGRARLAQELRTFEAHVDESAADTRSTPDLPALRAEWEALRLRSLRPASWLRTSTPELDEAQTWFEGRLVVPDPARYDETLRNLDQLLANASVTLATLPESFTDDDEYLRRIEQDFVRSGRQIASDLTRIREALPAKPRASETDWTEAHDALLRAVSSMERLMRSTQMDPFGLPAKSEGRARLEENRRALESARGAVERARRRGTGTS